MRALVWEGPERLSVRELPDPEPGPGEVLLVPEATGICGSEVEGYLGRQANRTPPLVMGQPPTPEQRARMLRAEDVADVCAFLAALPPSVVIPELTVLPAGLQALGATQ